ncbi:ABC transporter permease [Brevibacterium marinum]|uniref:Transport permease protein n=1 Tax=Brevibacterium marinum TaxID=418643 RepID=A0A846RZ69_9MICO|nr:ABC transporter permease [Brevibacterium marinum]NJC56745.1 ABC-2 type transport system permease protein/oleandomycin transport system permease protein [Brevibacterium marinum]
MTTATLPASHVPLRKHVGLGKTIAQSMTLSWRGMVKIRRNPAGLADVIIGPAIFLVLFGYVFGGAISGDTGEYLQYVFPGILGMMTLFATMGVGVSLSTDLSQGIFDRFRSLPIARVSPLIGAIGSDIVRQLVSLTALVGFGLLLGVRFETSIWSILAACALALGFAFAVSWALILLALAVKDPMAVQGLGAVLIIPITFASNIFVPVETMPGWMQTFASWNPVGHLVDAVRGLMMGGPVGEPLMFTLVWMGVFVILFAPLSLVVYNRRP